MNITVIGTGYVGLVTGACFSEMGNQVHCIDVDQQKINQLNQGIIPIYEPGLETIVKNNFAEGRLYFSTSIDENISKSYIYFISVGTPGNPDGSADLQYVSNVAHKIGQTINEYTIIVNKSTVPVGTADLAEQIIKEELDKRGLNIPFDVISNPEFLKEGSAVKDCMSPDRIIIGIESQTAKEIMKTLYAPFVRNHDRILFMRRKDAEMTKYVSNAMLATKISFINEISNICEHLGADIEQVRVGIGSDRRIGYDFIYPGCGYGGSCFPKDIKALIHIAETNEIDPTVLKAIKMRNDEQKHTLAKKLISKFGEDLTDITIGVWGLSFKAGTDDIREAPSTIFLENVISKGAKVKAYDPAAMETAKRELPKHWFEKGLLQLMEKQEQVFPETDALVLITEWNHFRNPDFVEIKQQMRGNLIIDGRNQYNPVYLRDLGFEYLGIGR